MLSRILSYFWLYHTNGNEEEKYILIIYIYILLYIIYLLYILQHSISEWASGANRWGSSANLIISYVALGPIASISSFVKWAPRAIRLL